MLDSQLQNIQATSLAPNRVYKTVLVHIYVIEIHARDRMLEERLRAFRLLHVLGYEICYLHWLKWVTNVVHP